jgi:hypothetical protein
LKAMRWLFACLLGIVFLSGSHAFCQDHGNGNGHGKGHEKHADDDDRDDDYYKHNEQYVRSWYHGTEGYLPPGLAKKNKLPPGLEKQLVRRGTLPPVLQKHIYPCPEELNRRLPPDCTNVVIGERIVLLNRKTNLVVDIFIAKSCRAPSHPGHWPPTDGG